MGLNDFIFTLRDLKGLSEMTDEPIYICPKGHPVSFGANKPESFCCGLCNMKSKYEVIYDGCELIFNRNWTVDELMGTVCSRCGGNDCVITIENSGGEICAMQNCNSCNHRWVDKKPKSSWQPKYLGNVKVKP